MKDLTDSFYRYVENLILKYRIVNEYQDAYELNYLNLTSSEKNGLLLNYLMADLSGGDEAYSLIGEDNLDTFIDYLNYKILSHPFIDLEKLHKTVLDCCYDDLIQIIEGKCSDLYFENIREEFPGNTCNCSETGHMYYQF